MILYCLAWVDQNPPSRSRIQDSLLSTQCFVIANIQNLDSLIWSNPTYAYSFSTGHMHISIDSAKEASVSL